VTAILRIEHAVTDFGRWRQAFDSDPAGRERSGVRRYRLMRACGEKELVLIDLEFDGTAAAETFLGVLQKLWRSVGFVRDPRTQVVELIEERSLDQVAEPA
jgi:hypothetical protein